MVFSTRKQKKKKKESLEPAFPSEEFPQGAPMVSCGPYFYAEHDGNDLHSYVKRRIDFYHPVFSLYGAKKKFNYI